MKLASLLSLGGGLFSHRGASNPFRGAGSASAPLAPQPKPLELRFVGSPLEAPLSPSLQPKSASPLEGLMSKKFVLLGLLGLGVCGFGAQHLVYSRNVNHLSQQLQQREQQLRTATQLLEQQKGLPVGQLAGQAPPGLTNQKPQVLRPERTSSSHKVKVAAPSSRRTSSSRRAQLADTKAPAHRADTES